MMTPGLGQFVPQGWLAGFIKGITKQCYIQNIKALGLMVSDMKFFYVLPIIILWELMNPGVLQNWTPWACLAGFR